MFFIMESRKIEQFNLKRCFNQFLFKIKFRIVYVFLSDNKDA